MPRNAKRAVPVSAQLGKLRSVAKRLYYGSANMPTVKEVKQALKAGCMKLDQRDSNNNTPVLSAAYHNQAKMLRAMAAFDHDSFLRGMAVRSTKETIGADVQCNALLMALRTEAWAALTVLLQHVEPAVLRATTHQTANSEHPFVHGMVFSGCPVTCLKPLGERGLLDCSNTNNSKRRNVLHAACHIDSRATPEATLFLIDHCEVNDLRAKDIFGRSPLDMARARAAPVTPSGDASVAGSGAPTAGAGAADAAGDEASVGRPTWEGVVDAMVEQMPYAEIEVFAMCRGPTARLKAALDANPDLVRVQDDRDKRPLHKAVSHSRPGAVEVLLAAGADIYHADQYGNTALDDLVYWVGHHNGGEWTDAALETLSVIAKHPDGANVACQQAKLGRAELTAHLLRAMQRVCPANLTRFLDIGGLCDVIQELTTDQSLAVIRCIPTEGAQQSLSNTASKETTELNCVLELHGVSADDQIRLLNALLEHGASVNERGVMGATPLHTAAVRVHNADIVNLLADRGADLHATDDYDMTPLETAQEAGNTVVEAALHRLLDNEARAAHRAPVQDPMVRSCVGAVAP